MHILILGAYCSCNLGDAVLCQCVANQLQQAWPDAQITIRDLIARDRLAPKAVPEESMLRRRALFASVRGRLARCGVDLILSREEKRVAANAAHLDAVCAGDYTLAVFAGGQLFMDGYGLFVEGCVERLKRRGIPVIFHACGMGPRNSAAIFKRLSAALNQENVIALSTRDPAHLADRLTGKPGAVQVSDPALDAAACFGLSRETSDTVGLGVMYPNGLAYGKVLRLWCEIIRELDRRGRKWQLFTNGDPADEVFARKILSRVGSPEDRIAPRNVTPEGLVRTISGYSDILSYRLHSQIVAVSLEIPAVALVWDEKQRHFFEACGCPERCLDICADVHQILNMLEDAPKGYDRLRLDRMRQQSRQWLLDAVERGLES